jgi:glycosyltransferase involved in cell wall biosynthesis
MSNRSILFVSTTTGWESCEELWSQAAVDLVRQGFTVSASVVETTPLHPRIQDLKAAGVNVKTRPARYSLWKRAWHHVFLRGKAKVAMEINKLLRNKPPKLVVFSEGNTYTPIEMIELCVSKNIPFIAISHKNWEGFWQPDDYAERYHNALRGARRWYFVSKENLHLTEMQLGFDLPNAEVVRNPFNTDYRSSLAWPVAGLKEELRLASVARLDPGQKGQDILLEALASPAWENRSWHLTLYGGGEMRRSLERLAARFGLSARVTFAGHVASVEGIWVSNHVLVMPSRYEGLPLAMVEAMLCGRPVLATDVAGHSEVIVDGVTGFLAGPPTVATIAQALERLWDNRANLENMGNAGAKRIREIVPADPGRVFAEKLKLFMS